MKAIRLKPGAAQRIKAGHLWVFSNEIMQFDKTIPPGEDVMVVDHRGALLGAGTFNPKSLIAVRIHDHGGDRPLDCEFIRDRVRRAWECRKAWFGEQGSCACRVVNSEGDSLPGLVVDKFDRYLSVQSVTAAMERRADWILDALSDVLSPLGIIFRNDSPFRDLEGLCREVSLGKGEIPSIATFPYGKFFLHADLWKGQKTGFYFDQRGNYGLLKALCNGARVLDGFCYTGIWGMHAALWGAREVVCADASGEALELARKNVHGNRLGGIRFRRLDLLDLLKEHAAKGESFDVMILDPPAYARSSRKIREAVKGYINLNKWGMSCVASGGYLITCSCSHHIDSGTFVEAMAIAAREARRKVRILGQGCQAVDHPWIPSMPETAYLKVLLLQIL